MKLMKLLYFSEDQMFGSFDHNFTKLRPRLNVGLTFGHLNLISKR